MKNLDQHKKDITVVKPKRYQGLQNAAIYDDHIHLSNRARRLSHWLEIYALRRALGRTEGNVALDGPCGTGRIHKVLSHKFSTVVSMDSSASMLHVHKLNTKSGMLCCGDLFRLPFPDNYFDWAVVYRLFHHLRDQANRIALLKSIGRVSRQGVVFTAWIDTFLNRRRGSRRQSLPKQEIVQVIEASGLILSNIDYPAWPFQPKCVITCRKTGRDV
jgi:SAM-dependent methyltransferase